MTQSFNDLRVSMPKADALGRLYGTQVNSDAHQPTLLAS